MPHAADDGRGPGGLEQPEKGNKVIPLVGAVTRMQNSEEPLSVSAEIPSARRRPRPVSSYSRVDELIPTTPLVLDPETTIAAAAARMIAAKLACAAVRTARGSYGLVTHQDIVEAVVAGATDADAPVSLLARTGLPTVKLGSPAIDALILLLDRDADHVLVLDDRGRLRGLVEPRDFLASTSTAGVTLIEQLRRARTVDELTGTAAGMTSMVDDLLALGLTSQQVIGIYATAVDTVVRRTIALTCAKHPELSLDNFTWLSLGSNGRRETVPSSDLDSAVVLTDDIRPAAKALLRSVLAEVSRSLTDAGLISDNHGVTAAQRGFCRTRSDWNAAAAQWLSQPAEHKGAIMTSLLLDARPVWGDQSLPAVTDLLSDLRTRPQVLRLLLQEALSTKARHRRLLDLRTWRHDQFDLKDQVLLPIVNLARGASLNAGATVTSTTERLRAAAGSTMLPADRASTLIEIFDTLQSIRLRQQLQQRTAGLQPTNSVNLNDLSPIERRVIIQAVRETAAAQRRVGNIAAYGVNEDWRGRQ